MDHFYRYEFIEVLLRIAEFRYMESYSPKTKPLATNFVEALAVLNSQVLKPFFEDATSIWVGFRENQLWTVEINSLYTNNMPQLLALFKQYAKYSDPQKLMLQRYA